MTPRQCKKAWQGEFFEFNEFCISQCDGLRQENPQGTILRYQPFILYFRKTNYLRK